MSSSKSLRRALFGQAAVFLGVVLTRMEQRLQIARKPVLMLAMRSRTGARAQPLDVGTVLHIAKENSFTPGGLVRSSVGGELNCSPTQARRCAELALATYMMKLRATLESRRRLGIVFDGSSFCGEDVEVFIVWCRELQLIASMYPQARILVCPPAEG